MAQKPKTPTPFNSSKQILSGSIKKGGQNTKYQITTKPPKPTPLKPAVGKVK